MTTRPATLLLHGLGGCSHEWSGAAAQLPGTVVVPDAPFHGGRAASGALDFPALAADAFAELDRRGIGSAVVAGISMGAATAVTMAALAPHRVSALLLVAPAWLDTPFPANLARLRKLGRIIGTRGLAFGWQIVSALPPVVGWRPAHQRELAQRFAAFDPEAVALALGGLPGEVPVIEPDVLASFGPRARVTGWAGDPIHPVDVAERTAALIGPRPPLIVRRPVDRAAEQALLAGWVRAVSDGR